MSIVVVVSIAAALALFQHAGDAAVSWAILTGGTAVAVVGYLDDRSSLPVYVRLVVHLASAAWSVYLVGGMPAIPWGTTTVQIGIWGDLFAILAIVWMLNLFNFMDGIDGIAASEAVFIACAGSALTMVGGGSVDLAAFSRRHARVSCCGTGRRQRYSWAMWAAGTWVM